MNPQATPNTPSHQFPQSTDGVLRQLRKSPSALLIYLRQTAASQEAQQIEEFHRRYNQELAARPLSSGPQKLLVAAERGLKEHIHYIKNRHILDGPLCEVTRSRFHECGALTHLTVLVGMLCAARSGVMPGYLRRFAALLKHERCYKPFCEEVDHEEARKRADKFILCIEFAGKGMASAEGLKSSEYVLLLTQGVEELGSEHLKLVLNGHDSPNDGTAGVITPVVRHAFIGRAGEGGRAGEKRRDAIRNFNAVLLRVRAAGEKG